MMQIRKFTNRIRRQRKLWKGNTSLASSRAAQTVRAGDKRKRTEDEEDVAEADSSISGILVRNAKQLANFSIEHWESRQDYSKSPEIKEWLAIILNDKDKTIDKTYAYLRSYSLGIMHLRKSVTPSSGPSHSVVDHSEETLRCLLFKDYANAKHWVSNNKGRLLMHMFGQTFCFFA
jgi:hypothetical protein